MPCSPDQIKSGKLVIRDSLADTGTRPIDPCTNYWLSPDLWLEGGIDSATAKVGVPNTVKVRVTNISNAPLTSVNVQVWVCDFTIGIGPSSGLASAGGANPMTGFVGQIDPGAPNAAVIACSPTWTPAAADAALNGGHVCMAANCYLDDGTDGAPIPTSSFNFCCDSHHGQHNIAVVAVSQRKGLRLHFPLYVANPRIKAIGAVAEQFVVRVQRAVPHLAIGNVEEKLLASGPHAKLALQPSTITPRTFGFPRSGLLGWLRQPVQENRFVLAPRQRTQFVLQASFGADEKVGNVHTFDLTQVDAKGEVTGGARVVAVIVP